MLLRARFLKKRQKINTSNRTASIVVVIAFHHIKKNNACLYLERVPKNSQQWSKACRSIYWSRTNSYARNTSHILTIKDNQEQSRVSRTFGASNFRKILVGTTRSSSVTAREPCPGRSANGIGGLEHTRCQKVSAKVQTEMVKYWKQQWVRCRCKVQPSVFSFFSYTRLPCWCKGMLHPMVIVRHVVRTVQMLVGGVGSQGAVCISKIKMHGNKNIG